MAKKPKLTGGITGIGSLNTPEGRTTVLKGIGALSPQQEAERARTAARARKSGDDQSNVNPVYKWIESVKKAAKPKNPTFRPPFAPDSLRNR